MLQISFEWLQFAFECFESHSNASNPIRIVRICIQILPIPFKLFEFGFEQFEFLSNCQNLHSNSSNPFRMVRIWIQISQIPFEWLELAFEWFESFSNGQNLISNASNFFRMLRISLESLEFAFECFKSLSNGQNLQHCILQNVYTNQQSSWSSCSHFSRDENKIHNLKRNLSQIPKCDCQVNRI